MEVWVSDELAGTSHPSEHYGQKKFCNTEPRKEIEIERDGKKYPNVCSKKIHTRWRISKLQQMAVERYLLVDLAQQGFNPRLVIKKPIKNFFELIMIILGTCYEQKKILKILF
jgi:hypothetical protein